MTVVSLRTRGVLRMGATLRRRLGSDKTRAARRALEAKARARSALNGSSRPRINLNAPAELEPLAAAIRDLPQNKRFLSTTEQRCRAIIRPSRRSPGGRNRIAFGVSHTLRRPNASLRRQEKSATPRNLRRLLKSKNQTPRAGLGVRKWHTGSTPRSHRTCSDDSAAVFALSHSVTWAGGAAAHDSLA